jgi:hypothetical protein
MAGLPWIKVEVATPNHPKLEKLEGVLGVEDGLGIVVRLWTYTASYYPDGRIPKASALAVEKFAMRNLTITYGGVPGMFQAGGPPEHGEVIEALVAAGWLDDDGDYWEVHDWEDFHAAHSKKAEQNRERQRRFRQRNRKFPPRNAGVTHPVTLLEGEGDGDGE